MKKILQIITLILCLFSISIVSANLWIFEDENSMLYCAEWDDCSIEAWADAIKENLDWKIQTEWSAVDYATNLTKQILSYVSLIAVLIIVFSWFRILTSAGSDDEIKKQKKVITWVFIWIILMWTSRAIVLFIMWIIWK